MKREEILAIEPGKELDTLIAEKVMAFKIESPNAEQCTIWDGREVRYFEPSTDISAAWEVVEKMYSWGGCDIGCYGKGGSGKWITVSTRTFSAGDVRVTAHTAPEAICKAALLAVLEDINIPGEETTE